jgi:hypothetical protein
VRYVFAVSSNDLLPLAPLFRDLFRNRCLTERMSAVGTLGFLFIAISNISIAVLFPHATKIEFVDLRNI